MRTSGSAPDSEVSEWRQLLANWRSLSAMVCVLFGLFLFVSLSALSILRLVYSYPEPRLGAVGQIAIALGLLGVGSWLYRPKVAPFRMLLWFYFTLVGAGLSFAPLSTFILNHELTPPELTVMGFGMVAVSFGILMLQTDQRRERRRRSAV